MVATKTSDLAYTYHPILKQWIPRTGMPLHRLYRPWRRRYLHPMRTQPRFHLDHPIHHPLSPFPSWHQSNHGDDSDAPYEPFPGHPVSKLDHLRRKRCCAKRAQRPLCPLLAAPSGQGWYLPHPLRRLPHQHSSACRDLCQTYLLNHPDTCEKARQPRGPPPPGQLGAFNEWHQRPPIHRRLCWPLLCRLGMTR